MDLSPNILITCSLSSLTHKCDAFSVLQPTPVVLTATGQPLQTALRVSTGLTMTQWNYETTSFIYKAAGNAAVPLSVAGTSVHCIYRIHPWPANRSRSAKGFASSSDITSASLVHYPLKSLLDNPCLYSIPRVNFLHKIIYQATLFHYFNGY